MRAKQKSEILTRQSALVKAYNNYCKKIISYRNADYKYLDRMFIRRLNVMSSILWDR